MYTNITQEKFFNLRLIATLKIKEDWRVDMLYPKPATSNKPCLMHNHTLISLKPKR